MSKDKKEEALIKRLLAINFLLKVIQSFIISVNTYEQKMIEIGNENEKIFPLLGDNHRPLLLHMAKSFVCLE